MSVRVAAAIVQKGQIRNTVLIQKKILEKSIDRLQQGLAIKKSEIEEYAEKDSGKVKHLRSQSDLIRRLIDQMQKSISLIEDYKGTVSK